MNTGDLQGKIIVVTGAGSGVGRHIACALAVLGAKLVLCDIREEPMQETLNQMAAATKANEAEAIMVKTDISQEADVQHLFQQAELRFGQVDVLINCAGIFDSKPIEDISSAMLERTLGINLKGTFLMCQAAFLLMRKHAIAGSIVNIASTAGEYGSISPASHYAASKGGVIALSKSLAREGAKDRIRVNVVSPGPLDTPMTNIASADQRSLIGERTLLGRVGTPEDIGNGVLFLASSVSSWITGEVLRVNGGSLI